MLPPGATEHEVTVGEEPWTLPGSLTLPVNALEGHTPLIILVHGSGPNDRDETVGPNKFFKELAYALAAKGVAVLRYDKRTKVYPYESLAIEDLTVYDETIDDAVAGIELAKSLGYGEVYVAGHSLGGMLIPRIAAETADANGYIMLAAAARPMADLMEEQLRYIYDLQEPLSETDRESLGKALEQVEAMRNVTPDSDLTMSDLMGMPVSYLLDLQGYEPALAAKDIQVPLLILQGEADYQVTMEDFQLYETAIDDNENVTMIAYPGLNHLFMPSAYEKSRPEEYTVQGCVDGQVIEDIAAFVLQ